MDEEIIKKFSEYETRIAALEGKYTELTAKKEDVKTPETKEEPKEDPLKAELEAVKVSISEMQKVVAELAKQPAPRELSRAPDAEKEDVKIINSHISIKDGTIGRN